MVHVLYYLCCEKGADQPVKIHHRPGPYLSLYAKTRVPHDATNIILN